MRQLRAIKDVGDDIHAGTLFVEDERTGNFVGRNPLTLARVVIPKQVIAQWESEIGEYFTEEGTA